LTAEPAGVGVKPTKDVPSDATDGIVWGVRRGGLRGSWVGVTGRRRFLRGGGGGAGV